MEKIEWKGSTLLAPIPAALVTCKDGDRENVLTIGWTGIINSQPPKTYISVRPTRYSYDIIKKSGVFAINLTTEALAKATDYCGIYTGAKVNKFQKMNLETENAKQIDCPILKDAPVVLECKVFESRLLGTHEMFLADIVGVDVDPALLSQDGKLNLQKANLLAYAHGDYYALGKKLGNFGYSTKKKHNSHK